jgi:hypothetical protein
VLAINDHSLADLTPIANSPRDQNIKRLREQRAVRNRAGQVKAHAGRQLKLWRAQRPSWTMIIAMGKFIHQRERIREWGGTLAERSYNFGGLGRTLF